MSDTGSPFFHIGYHKTGTTWLQQAYFAAHPQIRLLADASQPWNDRFLRYLIGSSDAIFDAATCRTLLAAQRGGGRSTAGGADIVSAERLSGHPYSGGFDSFRIAERLHEAFPAARIICVVRSQIGMIASVYKQLVAEGYPGSLESLLRAGAWKGTWFNLDFYQYDRIIRKYQRLFGRANVCVLAYETMRQQPVAFFGALCRFLGVAPACDTAARSVEVVNPSLPDAVVPYVRALNYCRRSELHRFPLLDLPPGLMRAARSLVEWLPRRGAVLDDAIKAEIRATYRESNLRLREIADADLTFFFEALSEGEARPALTHVAVCRSHG